MMWEIIRANQRKSQILLFVIASVLLSFGYLLGLFLDPENGGVLGLIIAFVIFLIMALASYFQGDAILLKAAGAVPLSRDIHPRLFNIVEEMKIASGLPVMPKIYLIPDPGMNAFASGVKPENSSLAVTAGLLEALNRDELQGVVAHEMSHIQNRDVLYMTLAGVMLGTFQLLSEVFLRGLFRSSYSSVSTRSRSRSNSSSDNGQLQIVLIILAVLLAILGPILIQLFYFSLSRKREYLADACGARLTRYPEGLASALEKISFRSGVKNPSKVTAALFIENPKPDSLGISGLTSTHPPIQDRILILRRMSGADYVNYQKAFSEIRGKSSGIIPASGLKDTPVSFRTASSEENAPPASGQIHGIHGLMDLMRAGNQFSFLLCTCGLKLKIPPEYKNKDVKCPRCSRRLEIPSALSSVVDRALEGNPAVEPAKIHSPLSFQKKTRGWETFKCECGHPLQISPSFLGAKTECHQCGREIRILQPA